MDLTPGTAVILGRDPSCDVVIEGAGSQVSRRHCRLTAQGGGHFLVEDLGSTNGVFVNGRRVHHGAVGPGDTLSLGSGFALSRLSGLLLQLPGAPWDRTPAATTPPCIRWRLADPRALAAHRMGGWAGGRGPNGLWIHWPAVPGGVVGVGDVVSLGSWSRIFVPCSSRPLRVGGAARGGSGDAGAGGARSPPLGWTRLLRHRPNGIWSAPRQRGGAGVFLALAAAVLLAIGAWSPQPGLLDQLGVGALVEPAVPPAEAIAMVSAELQAASSLGQHLDA